MKISYGIVIFVLAIFAAVMVSGCSFHKEYEVGTNQTWTVGNVSATSAASTASVWGTTAPGTPATLETAMNLNNVHWYEYKMTSQSGDLKANMDVKCELGMDYNGQKADKYTITALTENDGVTTTMVTENYADKSSNLGGHIKTTVGGEVTYDVDIPASSLAGTTNSYSLSAD